MVVWWVSRYFRSAKRDNQERDRYIRKVHMVVFFFGFGMMVVVFVVVIA